MDPNLEALKQALEAYLAGGGDMAEVQAMVQQMGDGGMAPPQDPGMGGGATMGLGDMPPPDDGGQMPPGGDVPPDAGDNMMDEMPPAQDAKTFEGARAGAKDRLKKLNKR